MTDALISGIGQSQVGRRLGRSALSLTVDAALEAIADAGLTTADIDGVSTWPGAFSASPGFSGVGCWDVQDALGLSLTWFSGGIESSGQLGAVINACAAVSAGLANHVLCFRTVWESTAQTAGRRASVVGTGSDRIDGAQQWLVPFGAVSAANWSAMIARRHFHEYGTTREQLGALAVNQRANAALNPKAIFREPLTLAQYLDARTISDPLCLLDCDIPVDGSTAVIVSRADAAADLRAPLVRVAAHSSALTGRPYWDQYEDLTSMAGAYAGRTLWQHTSLTVGDVDVAGIYDGFTILTLVWLEAIGACGKGEAGAFVEGGKRIARDGQFPLNTGGGQLSAGRLHGFGHLHEVCLQLRGEAGERQVPGGPTVGLVAAGGGELGGALLLTARLLRLRGFVGSVRGGLPGLGALPERGELRGRGGQAEARGEHGALVSGQLGVEPQEVVDAQPARADRGKRDRAGAQVQHVLVAFASDEEAVREVDGARGDRHRAYHRRRGERRSGPGDQGGARPDLDRGARGGLQLRLLEADRAEPARRPLERPPVADAVGDHRAAYRRAQHQAGYVPTAHWRFLLRYGFLD